MLRLLQMTFQPPRSRSHCSRLEVCINTKHAAAMKKAVRIIARVLTTKESVSSESAGKMQFLKRMNSRGKAGKPRVGVIFSIYLDFDVFELLKITVFSAMM